jgi:hypothetical protein
MLSTPGVHGGVNDGPAGELSPWVRLIAQECGPRAVRCGACQAHTDRRAARHRTIGSHSNESRTERKI